MVVKKKMAIGCLLFVNILLLICCWKFSYLQKSPTYDLKMEAVAKTIAAQQIIGDRLIGEEYTPITTTLGAKEAKLLSANPDFAAVAVDMLCTAGVRAGDSVAVNMSSSFPALNIAVISAIDALSAKPIIVSSIGASTWGANRPDFTWIDMECQLVENNLWPWRSRAVSIGGSQDRGNGLTDEGVQFIMQAIERSGVTFLESASLSEAINLRIELYKAENHGNLPKVLVNVGGSHVIFGEQGHNSMLRQGLTMGYNPSLAGNNGLVAEFVNANRPIIHFININRLAAEYGIYSASQTGVGKAFYYKDIPLFLRIILLCCILGNFFLLYYGGKRAWWK